MSHANAFAALLATKRNAHVLGGFGRYVAVPAYYFRPARIRDARGAGNSRRRLAGNFAVVDVDRQRLASPA